MPTFDADATQDSFIIDRYRVEKVLGRGGFGVVYLAYDEELERNVAIKVPHQQNVASSNDAEAYLTEARAVAKLDHPNIVPVIDVGRNEKYAVYIVSKFIEGVTLAGLIAEKRPSKDVAAELIARIADALQHAHDRGLVHRDVKPSNILIDTTGNAFLVDFGLALKEENLTESSGQAGTPAYMSPEQARGEGHRIDRRTDVFSLGVVFYELLTGKRPFQAETIHKLLEKIARHAPEPVRDIDRKIPKELERICEKSMSKKAIDRYQSAKEMADELRGWLVDFKTNRSPVKVEQGEAEVVTQKPDLVETTEYVAPISTLRVTLSTSTTTPPSSKSQLIRIVPKGLQSFDAYDADFFLELVPGPRDRFGLPESIRFWKTRIEEADPDNTFPLGVIYGPSGCGKSSLVKAGLVPRLADEIIVVYVEANADDTEARVIKGLRKRCSGLPKNMGLTEMLAAIRRGQGLPADKKKVLVIIDQFEQWLHANREESDAELVRALRQCDGGQLQSILMVRDDFWLAISRFVRELEIRPVEGQNSAWVDLFDLEHARKVLTAFGRAYGKISEPDREKDWEQQQFLDRAISGLAQEGKVISVRLALFAEMMKGKPWTLASLEEVGGIDGVGLTFLEETFSANSAPAQHRYHQKAARGVLKALLPDSGANIKGHMKSDSELLEASGYSNRINDFDELIEILNGELRLISPTDPEGKPGEEGSVNRARPKEKFYQLTHDYLVPRLREWLSRKQKETRRGRAELALSDLAIEWNTRKQNRHLPTFWQWLQISWLTQKKNRSPLERSFMRRARRYYATRSLAIGLLLAIATILSLVKRAKDYEREQVAQSAAIVDQVLTIDMSKLPEIIERMPEYRKWVTPLLQQELSQPDAQPDRKLRASLALLPADASHVDYLFSRLLEASPVELPVIRDALAPHREKLLTDLWAATAAADATQGQRLRAAAALATYDQNSPRWAEIQTAVCDDLIAVPAVHLALWMNALNPVGTKLVLPSSRIYRIPDPQDVRRVRSAEILAEYAADQPALLRELVLDADPTQFDMIYPKFEKYRDQEHVIVNAVVDQNLADVDVELKEKLAIRQANAAVILLKMQRATTVWKLFKHSADPRVRSYLIHRLYLGDVDASSIVTRLNEEPDVSIQRALMMSLGEYRFENLRPETREGIIPRIEKLYVRTDDSGLHAAAEWLLRKWGHRDWLKQTVEELADDERQREQRLSKIQSAVPKKVESAAGHWYVTAQGQTMTVIRGPAEFWMGSPETEIVREDDETLHKVQIDRTFAVGAKPVTVEQFQRFDPNYEPSPKVSLTADSPVVGIDWYRAALFCNWLSEKEGIPQDHWCYHVQKDEKGEDKVVSLAPNCLSLVGYRLPTEAEMEFATRAGTSTSHFYGETDELLPKYAWTVKSSQRRTWPVGLLKPNDLGLFDVHGNAATWCQDVFQDYPTANVAESADDNSDSHQISSAEARVFRGGSFKDDASLVRSAYRNSISPTLAYSYLGFRVARTLRSNQSAAKAVAK